MSTSKPKTLAAQRREAVERAFPGVICKRVAFECAHRLAGDDAYWRRFVDRKRYSLNFTVEASAETLVAHGLVTQEQIDNLPSSRRRPGLEKTNRGTYQARVDYFENCDKPTVAREMAAKIGISPAPKEVKRSAVIRGRVVWWHCAGNVVCPDWDLVRKQANRSRSTAA